MHVRIEQSSRLSTLARSLRLLQVVVCMLLSVGFTTAAQAEWSVDVYGGGAITQNADFTSTFSNSLLFVMLTGSDVEYATSGTVGGRIGYWFESLPWLGIGLDVFQFWPDLNQQQNIPVSGTIRGFPFTDTSDIAQVDLSVTSIGFDVLRVRAPLLKSPAFPHGRLQPYMSAGPTVFIVQVSDTTNLSPRNQSDTETVVGVKAGAGVLFLITQHWGLFGEYRFTYFNAEATFNMTPPATRITWEFNVLTNHFVGGLSFRW